MSAMSTGVPTQHLSWMGTGTTLLLAQLDALGDDDLGAPTLLPGWDRAQLLAHVARNADALGNLIHWAATGQETPMYPDPARRQSDIDESAAQFPGALRTDVRSSAHRLAEAMTALPEHAWTATVRSARGRAIPAAEIPWLRIREVWIHTIDLSTGTGFTAFPDPLTDALLTEASTTMGGKPDCPALVLAPTDRDHRWPVGQQGRTTATGTAANLLGWLLGRTEQGVHTQACGLPTLPAWL
jgi:maleylpyruvate isomerase